MVAAVLVVEEMLGVNNILELKDIREDGEPFIVVAELFPLCNNVDNAPLISPLVDLLCPMHKDQLLNKIGFYNYYTINEFNL